MKKGKRKLSLKILTCNFNFLREETHSCVIACFRKSKHSYENLSALLNKAYFESIGYYLENFYFTL